MIITPALEIGCVGMKKAVCLSIIITTLCCLLTSCNLPNFAIGDDLYNAIISRNLECVKEAVENGADVNKGSILYALHEVPLLYCINNSYLDVAEYLLSQGADPNYIDRRNGISILMYTVGGHNENGITYTNASNYGAYKIVLNDERTDVNLTGKLGYTALDYTCRDVGQLEIVNDLINRGAKITATTMKCAFEGYKRGGEESVIKIVFDAIVEQKIPSGLPSEIEAAIQGDSEKLISLANGKSIKQENRQLAMLLTCAFGDVESFKALAGRNTGANSDFFNEAYWGKTYLSVACSYGNIEVVKYLLSENADVEKPAQEKSVYHEKTPLAFALKYNHLDIADYLVAHGAKLEIAPSGTSGNRPDVLEIACENGSVDTVKWIVAHGYPLDEERIARSLSNAARNDHIDVLRYFLEDLKVDVNSEYFHSTALSSAKSIETIRFLLDNGADVNGGKSHIFTPLERAVRGNRADLVLYLLDNGADPDLAGIMDDGYKPARPLTVAIQEGYYDVVKVLVDHGADLNYQEDWASGRVTPLEIAEMEKSQHIIDYIMNKVAATDN
jgi:ankyrin repeat protein